MSKEIRKSKDDSTEDKKFPLPDYNEEDDIYNEEKEEPFEEDPPLDKKGKKPAKIESDDLDIPGSELDDPDENLGEEDEENNYYSLGGDDNNELEEDQDE